MSQGLRPRPVRLPFADAPAAAVDDLAALLG
jgi:hypothetical protein